MEVKRYKVFSFGSNSLKQLQGRLQNQHLTAKPAKAQGYTRIFCGSAVSWGQSGVASLHKLEGSVTYGAVVDISEQELVLLDGFEGHPRMYQRHPIQVEIFDKEWIKMEVICYFKVAFEWKDHPKEQYLTAVHVMLNDQFGHFEDGHEAKDIVI